MLTLRELKNWFCRGAINKEREVDASKKSISGKVIITGAQIFCGHCDRIFGSRFAATPLEEIEPTLIREGYKKVKGKWICPRCLEEPLDASEIRVVTTPIGYIEAGEKLMQRRHDNRD